jgi:hypothetical protein
MINIPEIAEAGYDKHDKGLVRNNSVDGQCRIFEHGFHASAILRSEAVLSVSRRALAKPMDYRGDYTASIGL